MYMYVCSLHLLSKNGGYVVSLDFRPFTRSAVVLVQNQSSPWRVDCQCQAIPDRSAPLTAGEPGGQTKASLDWRKNKICYTTCQLHNNFSRIWHMPTKKSCWKCYRLQKGSETVGCSSLRNGGLETRFYIYNYTYRLLRGNRLYPTHLSYFTIEN